MPRTTPYSKPVFKPALEAIVTTAHEQAARGLAEYHKPLETHNGRSAYKDAMQDGVDTLMYIKQAEMEHTDLLRWVAAKQQECLACNARHKQELAEMDALALADDNEWEIELEALSQQNDALESKVSDLKGQLRVARQGCKRLNDELKAAKQELASVRALARSQTATTGGYLTPQGAPMPLSSWPIANEGGHDLITEGLIEAQRDALAAEVAKLKEALTQKGREMVRDREERQRDFRADINRMAASRDRWKALYNGYANMQNVAPATGRDAEDVMAEWNSRTDAERERKKEQIWPFVKALNDLYENGDLPIEPA